MINKLSQDFGDGNFPIDYIVTISRKVDEIIDYLSDKEASKGECPECGDKRACFPWCRVDPPQQEESRGETKTPVLRRNDIKTATKHCDVCKAEKGWIHLYEECEESPQLKEESPKEDEGDTWSIWEGFDDRAGTLTRNFGKAGRPANIQDLQEVFVSKEKIKNQLLEVEKTFNRVGLVSSLTVRNMIKEVIKGLEELC